MTISGIASASQISKTIEQQLVAGVALGMDISSNLVKLHAVKGGLRRLLALSSTFRVLAADTSEAIKLQEKAQKADMQVHTLVDLLSINTFTKKCNK